MNMETLESRLSSLIKGRSGNNHNQRHQQLVNSTSSIATMIPTPGMTHSGNSPMMVASSIDSSMIAASGGNTILPATVTTGSLLSTGGIQSGSFNRSDGKVDSHNFFFGTDYFPFLDQHHNMYICRNLV